MKLPWPVLHVTLLSIQNVFTTLQPTINGDLSCVVDFDRFPEATDEENDMLDLAFGLTDTSRLGCQVRMCKELDGIQVTIPSATRNMAVDGYKPKPH